MLPTGVSTPLAALFQIPPVPDGPSPISQPLSSIITVGVVVLLAYVAWRVWRRIAERVRYDSRDDQ